MGKIDVCDKTYFSDMRRFADFINVHIYQKRKTVFPKDLLLMKGKYPSISSASGEKERDILMEHKTFSVCYGLELEESVDYSMPERMLSYDVGEYERQIREIAKQHKDKKQLRELFSRESFQNLCAEAQRAILATLKMDVVIAKREKEDISMCRAFEELMQDQWEEGKEEGRGEGENLLTELLKHLLSENRDEDVKLAICDTGARKRFYQEYGML